MKEERRGKKRAGIKVGRGGRIVEEKRKKEVKYLAKRGRKGGEKEKREKER